VVLEFSVPDDNALFGRRRHAGCFSQTSSKRSKKGKTSLNK
jgi:hypothetical protein